MGERIRTGDYHNYVIGNDRTDDFTVAGNFLAPLLDLHRWAKSRLGEQKFSQQFYKEYDGLSQRAHIS